MDLTPEAVRLRYAEFAHSNIHMFLSIWRYSLPDLISATHVCFVAGWGPRAMAAVGVTRINRLLNRAMASRAKKGAYRYRIAKLRASPDKSGSFPYDADGWRRLIVKFSLFEGNIFLIGYLPCAILSYA